MFSFFPIVQKFLQQANEGNNLTVNSYPKEYKGLKVKVSFGKGNYARIPWITFLYEGQTTNNGIYPGFLYYKQQSLLILSYIISETHRPVLRWSLPDDVLTIGSYFRSNGFGSPERYGDSFVYKVYSPISEIDPSTIDRDLEEIITRYKELMNRSDQLASQSFEIQRITAIKITGLLFTDDLLYRYAISLLTKPFVILSGLSGSGKTRLALTFAKWLSEDASQVKIVSVGSDWNNREYLLGYPNALQCGTYIKPENDVLDFIINADKNPDKPYFLILDEMNLSYVERYFADFLSTMESHEAITLHPDTYDWKDCDVPPQIKLPVNLYITGTINVDETTYMFSPKVLDRANVIEFRINDAEMEKFLTECQPVNPDKVNHLGANVGRDFIYKSQDPEFTNDERYRQILLAFFKELKRAGAEFGYRTAIEIYRFIAQARKLEIDWDDDKLIDIIVMQKMLPKLHGSRKKMQPILTALWELCLNDNKEKILIESEEITIDPRF
ncbi:MAG: DUF3578 domain-containing protein [Bacteroides sp.]|nr:DUF3578 domain-containing protein [Bacteroides sp.]